MYSACVLFIRFQVQAVMLVISGRQTDISAHRTLRTDNKTSHIYKHQHGSDTSFINSSEERKILKDWQVPKNILKY